MKYEAMTDVSEWEGFGWLRGFGWRVSVSARLWDRYVRVPDQADPECEKERHDLFLSRLQSALRVGGNNEVGPFAGFGFQMNALLNDPRMGGDAVVATVEVTALATIDCQLAPRLMVFLASETLTDRMSRPALPN